MKTATTINTQDNKLQFIDCLRGIAIIMVIFNHADWYLPKMDSFVQTLSDYGQMGVQLFFVVSAFTLCLSMDRRNDANENLKTFYIRRYFRIAPLYYVGIPLYLIYYSVVVPLIEGDKIAVADWYTVPNILANVFFVNDLTPGDANNRVVPGGWSIGTETSFYAIFPFIFLLYKKYRNNDVALMLIPFLGLVFSFFSIHTLQYLATQVVDYDNFFYFKQNGRFLYFNLLCQLPVFLMGISLYFRSKNFRKSNSWDRVSLIFAFLGFTFIAIFVFSYFTTSISLLPFLPAVSFFFLFLIFKEIPAFSNRILARIGQLSFSIYLFHFVFAFEGSRYLNHYLQDYISTEAIFLINVVFTTIITAGVAVLSEKFIEKPGIDLGKRIIKRVKAKSAVPNFKPVQMERV